jgi:hypothetical protein
MASPVPVAPQPASHKLQSSQCLLKNSGDISQSEYQA